MELEQMSSAELISLVRRQEQELVATRITDAADKAFLDAVMFGSGCIQVTHIPYSEMLKDGVQQGGDGSLIDEATMQQGGGELPQDEHLNMALHLVDACMDVTMVEPEDAAAWQIVRRQFLAQRAASVPAMKQTDLSKQLRDLVGAEPGAKQLVILPKTVLAAADEIDRYYTGMVNWKASAEAKDTASVPSQAETREQKEQRQRARMQERFAGRDASQATADFDLPAESDSVPAQAGQLLAEPTEAMLNAARDWAVKKYGIGIGNDAAIGCWKAMFAAVPAASVQPNRELMQLLGMTENDDLHDIMASAALRIKRLQAQQPGIGRDAALVDRIELLHGAYITRETKTTGANGWLLRNEHGIVRALDVFETEFVDCTLAAQATQAAPEVARVQPVAVPEGWRELSAQIVEALGIFTYHDSHANLRHKYGAEWWVKVDAMREQLSGMLAAAPSAPEVASVPDEEETLLKLIDTIRSKGYTTWSQSEGIARAVLAAANK